MKRSILLFIVVIFGMATIQGAAFGRGFGGFGGFHGGGGFGGFHAGGFHAGDFGGFHAGGFGGGDFGGSHAGGFGGYGGYRGGDFDAGGYHAGGFDAGGARTGGYGDSGGYRAGGFDAGGFHAGGYDGAAGREGGWGGSPDRGQLDSFLGLPTDAGMHAAGGQMVAGPAGAAAWRGGATGQVAQGPMGTTVAHGAAGVQGAAIGPGGVAAGGRAVGGTAVEGPRGNVYTHSTSASRGFAAGSQGAAAWNGYGHASGTHYWSPTYCHAQGLAAQRWWHGSGVFTSTWCGSHPWAWCPAGYTGAAWAAAAWRTATWPAIGAWLTWTGTPVLYYYGDNITYQDNSVYYGSQPVATAQQYYQQAVDLAGSNDAVQPGTDVQWMPLGVFSLMTQGQTAPEMVFQLAVDKAGAIKGNYYDQVADTTAPVTGSVDKKDQRVAWHVGSNKNLVVETGLYDLTQDRSTALVHYVPDRTEQYVLVRIKQPNGQDAQN